MLLVVTDVHSNTIVRPGKGRRVTARLAAYGQDGLQGVFQMRRLRQILPGAAPGMRTHEEISPLQ